MEQTSKLHKGLNYETPYLWNNKTVVVHDATPRVQQSTLYTVSITDENGAPICTRVQMDSCKARKIIEGVSVKVTEGGARKTVTTNTLERTAVRALQSTAPEHYSKVVLEQMVRLKNDIDEKVRTYGAPSYLINEWEILTDSLFTYVRYNARVYRAKELAYITTRKNVLTTRKTKMEIYINEYNDRIVDLMDVDLQKAQIMKMMRTDNIAKANRIIEQINIMLSQLK